MTDPPKIIRWISDGSGYGTYTATNAREVLADIWKESPPNGLPRSFMVVQSTTRGRDDFYEVFRRQLGEIENRIERARVCSMSKESRLWSAMWKAPRLPNPRRPQGKGPCLCRFCIADRIGKAKP